MMSYAIETYTTPPIKTGTYACICELRSASVGICTYTYYVDGMIIIELEVIINKCYLAQMIAG